MRAPTEPFQDAPIAEYLETGFLTTRRFTITRDHLFIETGGPLRPRVEIELALADIHPGHSNASIANNGFRTGAAIFATCALGAAFIYLRNCRHFFAIHDDPVASPLAWVCSLMLIGVVGLIVGLATSGRIQYAAFSSDGPTPVFDIARKGRSKNQFDTFVSTLEAAIDKAHRLGANT